MSTNFNRISIIIIALALFAGFSMPSQTHAGEYIATQSGNWNDPATWGGTVPTATDDVEIPFNITVTISAGANITRDGLTTIDGTVDNYGTINNVDMIEINGAFYNSGAFTNASWFDSYGTFINLPTGVLTINETVASLFVFENQGTIINNDLLDNEGTFKNSGVITNHGELYNAYMSTFTNTETGSIDSLSGGVFTNDGTVNNNGALVSSGSFNNNEILVNNSNLTNNGVLTNLNMLTNNGTLTNNSTISNDGTVSNNASIINNGSFNNSCDGVFQGNAVSGNPITLLCVTDTPTPTPTNTPTPIACVSLPAPSLIDPAHRAHSGNSTPTFSWSAVNGALAYRVMIYRADRSYEFKKRVFSTSYTLNGGETLSTGKYMWRVRTQDAACGEWGGWSGRNTLIID